VCFGEFVLKALYGIITTYNSTSRCQSFVVFVLSHYHALSVHFTAFLEFQVSLSFVSVCSL